MKLDSTHSTVVNPDIEWIPIDETTPKNAKILLINRNNGVAVLGKYSNYSDWTHWQGLPRFPEDIDELSRLPKRQQKTDKIRQLLRISSEGLTLAQLAVKLSMPSDNVRHLLKDMQDVYIDRWVPAPRQQWAAVWMCVVAPDSCPRPVDKPNP